MKITLKMKKLTGKMNPFLGNSLIEVKSPIINTMKIK